MVVGEGDDARFERMTSRADWPQLTVALPVGDDELEAVIQAERGVLIAETLAAGVEGQRKPIRIVMFRSKTRVGLVLITPHHFTVRRHTQRERTTRWIRANSPQ